MQTVGLLVRLNTKTQNIPTVINSTMESTQWLLLFLSQKECSINYSYHDLTNPSFKQLILCGSRIRKSPVPDMNSSELAPNYPLEVPTLLQLWFLRARQIPVLTKLKQSIVCLPTLASGKADSFCLSHTHTHAPSPFTLSICSSVCVCVWICVIYTV